MLSHSHTSRNPFARFRADGEWLAVESSRSRASGSLDDCFGPGFQRVHKQVADMALWVGGGMGDACYCFCFGAAYIL